MPDQRVTLEVNANGTIPGEPILEIPDSLKQTTADGDRWVLPASGEHGSLGFDFTQMPADLRSGPAVYSIDTFDGPKGSRYIAGTVTDGAMNVTLDTTRDPNRGFTVDAAAVPSPTSSRSQASTPRWFQHRDARQGRELLLRPAPLTSSSATPRSRRCARSPRRTTARHPHPHPLQTLRIRCRCATERWRSARQSLDTRSCQPVRPFPSR